MTSGNGKTLGNPETPGFLISIFAIYLIGVPWLAYLAGWEVAYIWGIKNFVLAEIFKVSILALTTEKLLKLRKFI